MWFRRLGVVTITTVYLLILAGGIVRSSGSGMGCPDWPTCFGSWVPPTSINQLPPNYQEIYGAKLKGEVVFNALKTWIEYVNRLLGALTGILIFGTLIASIPFLKKDKAVFYLSLLAFVLVGFQGWLGSKVVSSELHPVLVTMHMIVAIGIVLVLIYALARSYSGFLQEEKITAKPFLNALLVGAMLLTLVQVVLGTQVRETIDEVARRLSYLGRENWISKLGMAFYLHRSFSLLVLVLHGYMIYQLRRHAPARGMVYSYTSALVVMIIVEIAVGVVMAYFAIPAFLQPIHLTLAVVIVGIQFVTLLLLNQERVFRKTKSVAASVVNSIH